MEWFRWYDGACSDDKWPLISRKAGVPQAFVVAVWAMLLETASQNEDRGCVEDFDPEAADALLGMPDGSALAIYDALCSGKKPRIIDGCIASWMKRQPKREREDDSSERVKRYREKQRQVTQGNTVETPACGSVTPCNATVTPVERHETPRTEQNREEINTSLPTPEAFGDEDAAQDDQEQASQQDSLVPDGQPAKKSVPACPYEKIVTLYHESLPEHQAVKAMNNQRRSHLKARWAEIGERLRGQGRDDGEQSRLVWLERFFLRARESPFLTGRVQRRDNGRPFMADLDFLFSPKGFTGVIEGKYDDDGGVR